MFSKVLIANRGAIAVRLCRTLHEMGISSIAIYADADSDSAHVSAAHEAYALGQGNVGETYLNVDRILEICTQSGAEAVHPGYGFLSENEGFAHELERRGISFIGPRPEHLKQFGLKHEARRLASAADVNLLSGSGVLQDLDSAIEAAQEIGYPVMLKSSAGGGGIGMQRCDSEEELQDCFTSVERLASNAFGDKRMFLESCVVAPRHVEVQAFGDGEGKVAILGDRDCSLQRRHQKVIEECPAPNLPDAVRRRMHDDARALLSSVSYRSAGTVEFLYDPVRETATFLEVNTRLQVEHGVTELVYGVDIVRWMLELAAHELPSIDVLSKGLKPTGAAIQARVCAEDPYNEFRPTPGKLSVVEFPKDQGIRVDTWVSNGCEVSALYDSLLSKVIAYGEDREQARRRLQTALTDTVLHGIETNLRYLAKALVSDSFVSAEHDTSTLLTLNYQPHSFEVVTPGAQTTVQAWPGRLGYWHVGVPPSGPMDDLSFRLGNRLLGNAEGVPGVEITVSGPNLSFNSASTVLVAGQTEVQIESGGDSCEVNCWQPISLKAGDVLKIGRVTQGVRAYLAFRGGLDIPDVMGSAATFTLGEIGGLNGTTLKPGDVLHVADTARSDFNRGTRTVAVSGLPDLESRLRLRITMGPHCTEDFLTSEDMAEFVEAEWSVHYNSSRTGVRLTGPRPRWAREDGGDAGLHPSNVHDNAYAFGAIDFTGDMPVVLGPDGPSLGGFVCPGAVIEADRWKLGQLQTGDRIQFIPVTDEEATQLSQQRNAEIENPGISSEAYVTNQGNSIQDPILFEGDDVCVRRAAQEFILIEFGPNVLDLELRMRVHSLDTLIRVEQHPHIKEATSGIRSLLVRFDSKQCSALDLVRYLEPHFKTSHQPVGQVPSRIVRLPLSWDDPACREAVEKYVQSVRADAPWCPDNIEFIRRINGLPDCQAVKDIVFNADYLVMGLGDVYLGAPVATPVDPRHRLVTTKYNPARTWTAANSVGVGGAYLCIYGMEGPGGYQFVGRTVQVWDLNRRGPKFDKYWLLREFDRIQFYEVDAQELIEMRLAMKRGALDIDIEEGVFDCDVYRSFLADHANSIDTFERQRRSTFSTELEDWRERGLLTLETNETIEVTESNTDDIDSSFVSSPLAGSIWSINASVGQQVDEGEVLFVVESMKAEFEVTAAKAGVVSKVLVSKGQAVQAGQALALAME